MSLLVTRNPNRDTFSVKEWDRREQRYFLKLDDLSRAAAVDLRDQLTNLLRDEK